MIPLETKEMLVKESMQARKDGARLSAIARMLEVSSKSLQRWSRKTEEDKRKGSARHVPHKLSDKERSLVIKTACSTRFKDMYPNEIVATLASEGTYIVSESTFYRIMKQERLLSHRRKSKLPVKRTKPRLVATASDQVYSWDITWLKTNVNGIYYYLYLFLDIFSRRIVEWEVHTSESSVTASNMLARINSRKYIRGLTLHSDNGSPMKGLSMLATMYQLGVMPSFSRPHVSEDNPYSESLFRTLKYRPAYPLFFDSIEQARNWVSGFVYWYNHEHLHSGIGYVTPHQRHYGQDIEILNRRRQTYEEAQSNNPGRWSRGHKQWQREEVVYINPAEEKLKLKIS